MSAAYIDAGVWADAGEPDFPSEDIISTTEHSQCENEAATAQMESPTDNMVTTAKAASKIGFTDIMKAAGDVARYAGNRQDLLVMVLGSMIELGKVCRGAGPDIHQRSFVEIIDDAEKAYGSSSKQFFRQVEIPLPGAGGHVGVASKKRKISAIEAAKANSKKKSTCSFCCASDGHQRIRSCPKLAAYGKIVTADDAQNFINQISGAGTLYPMKSLAVNSLPVVQGLPEHPMKWLVVHARCLINVDQPESLQNICLVVTILGHGGELLDVRYRHRAVISSLVVSWIQKLSKSTRTIVDAAMMEAKSINST